MGVMVTPELEQYLFKLPSWQHVPIVRTLYEFSVYMLKFDTVFGTLKLDDKLPAALSQPSKKSEQKMQQKMMAKQDRVVGKTLLHANSP